jgi:hypothetical protein
MSRRRFVGRPPERTHRRVPDCDIVDVGHLEPDAESDPVNVGEIASPKLVRLDTHPRAKRQQREQGDLTRPLTALLALGLGLLGAMYMGKRYADARVIIVPATVNERSVITWGRTIPLLDLGAPPL